jgi:hypothetical protein
MSGWQPPQYDPRQSQQYRRPMPPLPDETAAAMRAYRDGHQQPSAFPRGYHPQPQPPYGYYPPPVQVNVIQNAHGPRMAVTRGRLGSLEELFHWTMIICTCGLWLPVYLSRKRSKRSVTTFL